jgi:endoglucanase
MDHPGFEARRMVGRRRVLADWLGWVHPDYFVGTKVRFFSEGRWVYGVIRSMQVAMIRGRRRPKTVQVDVRGEVLPGSLGMWDLPDPVIRNGKVIARGCDDVAGVAAILAAMERLSRSTHTESLKSHRRDAGATAMHPETLKSHRRDAGATGDSGGGANRKQPDVMALLTRAEEIGFAGAIAACRAGTIPRNARVVAVETSSEIPGVRMGAGPILRVGDQMATFSPGLTGFAGLVAADLAKKDSTFQWQRKLMDGGTCESTVYHAEGYDATGLCIALGNYHNMDTRRKRIASEYIHLADWDGLVKWFVALATTRRPHDAYWQEVDAMVARLERVQRPQLNRTAGRVRGRANQ